jgi:hypothetical protein
MGVQPPPPWVPRIAGSMTMDARRFDQISKKLSTTGTRRRLLRVLAASPLAGSLAVLRTEEGRARKRHCKRCATSSDCKANQLCDNRCCRSCTVCSGNACSHSSVQDAINAAKQGATVRICPGVYNERLLVDGVGRKLTLVGAGSGDDENENTILDANGLSNSEGGVMWVSSTSKFLVRSLRLTGGGTGGGTVEIGGGVSVFNITTVTLKDCEVTGNTANNSGGGISNAGTLTLINTNVTDNTSTGGNGGGIYNTGTLTLKEQSNVTGNDVPEFRSGGGILNNSGATVNAFNNSVIINNLRGSTPDDCDGDGTFNFEGGSACGVGP